AGSTLGSGGSVGGMEFAAIYDTVMRYNTETKEYEPNIAESLTPNEDNTEWTLKLRPNVTFSDGTPYNAEAVRLSFQRHVQFRTSRASALVIGAVKDYTVIDPLTLKFTLNYPWRNFAYLLAWTPGMVPSPTALQQCGDKAPRDCPFNL